MKTIGNDISLDTCKEEGYLMVEFDARKKYDKALDYRFYAFYPEYVENYTAFEDQHTINKGDFRIDINFSAVDLWELYKNHKKGIESFIGSTYKIIPEDIYTLLNLANDIRAYCGLN